jgi:hypothetical protein
MRYALSMKHCIISFFTLFVFISCGGKKGELRITGEIKGLNNAALTMYSRDGVFQGIDTLHVIQGKIDWTCPYSKIGGSITIVYPTFSTLTVFGSSGDVIVIEGDAKQLNATKVKGNIANESYTLLRAQIDKVNSATKDSLVNDFISKNPESPVSRFLQLEKLAKQKPKAISIGEKLPVFSLVTRKGDTITTDSLSKKYSLITFWANWRGGISTMNTRIRRLRRQAKVPLECISYNMDVNATILAYIERTDTITWHSFADQQVFLSPLASQFGIRDIPYYILADTTCTIIASGKDWQTDIEPHLPLITSPQEKEENKK